MARLQTDKSKQPQPQAGPQPQAQHVNPATIGPEVVAHYAQVVRRDTYPAHLWGINEKGIMAGIPLDSWRKYVEDYVLDATGGDCKKQPILRMLIEQLLLLNQTIGRLHGDGLNATDIEQRRINVQLAAQLTGELRRLASEIDKMVQSRRSERLPFQAATAEKNRVGKNKLSSKQVVA